MSFWFSVSSRGFVIVFCLIGVMVSGAIVLLNAVVDPYWAYGIVDITGFNNSKPEFTNSLRLGKARSVCRVRPNAVILGSSRAELGLNPEHPGFRRFAPTVYSLAMAGTGMYEMYRTLQHAYYTNPDTLKFAVIALDELMFNANREMVVFGTEVFGYDEKRLALNSTQNCVTTFFRDADLLLFARGVKTSLSTLQNQEFHELYLGNGMRHPLENGLARGMPKTGHRLAFINNERYYMHRVWTAGPERRFCVDSAPYGSTLDTLRKIVDFARKHGIELRFILSPQHARMLIALREAGMWPVIEAIKRGVVRVLTEDAERHPAEQPFPLWDFYNFNSISVEPVPPINSVKAEMRWYWEISHYKHATGDLVLDRVLGHRAPKRTVPADFGVLLNAKNVEPELTRLLLDSRAYDRRFPDDVKEIQDTANKELAESSGVLCLPSYVAFKRGAEFLERKENHTAEQWFKRALQLQRQEKLEFIARGLPYREGGLAAEVDRALRTGVVSHPLATPNAYQERGNKRRDEGDLNGAIADYTEAIRRGPTNAALHYLRGVSRAAVGDHAGALADYEVILKLEPKNATVLTLKAQALAARETVTWDALQRRGEARRDRGDLDGAIADFTDAMQLAPLNPALPYLRATVKYTQKEFAGTISDLDRVLDIDPGNVTALNLRRQALVQRDEERWRALQELGDQHREHGRLAQAIQAYSESIQLSPSNAALYYLRGISRTELGDHVGALADFDAVLNLDPNNATATALRERALAAQRRSTQ